jgi:predicted porin
MKKSLLAVSLLAAFGAASAASTVTLYGVLDASIGQTKTTATDVAGVATATTVSSLSREGRNNGLSGSRFGIKGSEELGYGLKGNFVVEEAISTSKGELAQGITDGSSSGRQTWLGLSGNFGAISLGRQYTPFFEAIEPLTNVDAGGAFTLDSESTIKNTVRASSSVKYVSPVFSGFKFAALLASDKTAPVAAVAADPVNYKAAVVAIGATKLDTSSLSLSYTGMEKNALSVAVAMNQVKKTVTGGTTDKIDHVGVGASYNFGVAQAMLSFTQEKDTSTAYTGTKKTTDTTVAVKVPFGAAYVLAAVGQNKMTDGTSAATSTVSSKGTNFVVGTGYKLSERTEVYARYSKTEAKNKTVSGANNGSTKVDMFGLGVKHSF